MALLIGCSKYDYHTTRLPRLVTPAYDLGLLSDELTKYKFDVRELENPNRSQLVYELENLRKKVTSFKHEGQDCFVIIYYSGMSTIAPKMISLRTWVVLGGTGGMWRRG